MKTTKTKKKIPKLETPESKVVEIEKGLVPLQKEAKKMVVKNIGDVQKATSFLAKVKGYTDRVNELVTFFTEPYVDQRRVALEKKREIEEMFAPKLAPLNEMIETAKRAISEYTIQQERKAQAEEDRKQKIRDKANKKREEQGKTQILEPIKSVERVDATVKTDEGRTTTKKVWAFEVLNTTQMCADKEFVKAVMADVIEKSTHERILRGLVKNGAREVGGVRIYQDIKVDVSTN